MSDVTPHWYNVVLWDDDEHSYEYVIGMLTELFDFTKEAAFELAAEVDRHGKTVCFLASNQADAELKQEQIENYGKDERINWCKGSMRATIEPAKPSESSHGRNDSQSDWTDFYTSPRI